VDQSLAQIPFNPVTVKFYGETHWWVNIVYYGVSVATWLLATVPLIIFFRYYKKSTRAEKNTLKRMLLISYLSLIIGPGLVANTFFKQHWGRARPYQVLRDHHPFSLPWQPHFDRPADNSFPSGHVTIGAFLGIPFIAARRRKIGVALCGGGFVLVGVVRWLQGGHYFSDICMAGIIVWMVNILITMLVDKYFIPKEPQAAGV
jgi:membrane-associated phospholipid phosphatase